LQIVGLIRLETYHVKPSYCGGPGNFDQCYSNDPHNVGEILTEDLNDQPWGKYKDNFGVSDPPVALDYLTFPFKGYQMLISPTTTRE